MLTHLLLLILTLLQGPDPFEARLMDLTRCYQAEMGLLGWKLAIDFEEMEDIEAGVVANPDYFIAKVTYDPVQLRRGAGSSREVDRGS